MNRDLFITIESQFDQCDYESMDPVAQKYLDYLQLLLTSEFETFYQTMQDELDSMRTQPERGFEMGCCALWLVLGSETQYNVENREKFLTQFHLIADQNPNEIFEYYRQLFKAVSYAYSSLQIESEACYRKSVALAEMIQYQRGMVRSLTGLGLIHMEMNDLTEAKRFLTRAQEIAAQHEWQRSINRIKQYLGESSGTNASFYRLYNEIKSLINEGDFLFARRKLVEAEVLRRQSNMHRKAYSFYILYAVMCGLQGKHNICNSILRRTTDRVLKMEAITMLRNGGYSLDPVLLNEARSIEMEIYAIAKIQKIDIHEIKNTNIRQLLLVLADSILPVNKATLFEHIFQIKYDPTLHDPKLYKLIMMTRKTVSSDVIINHHGTYSFNNKKFKFVS